MPNGFSSKILGLFTGFPTGVEDMERGGGAALQNLMRGGWGVRHGGCFEGF